MHYSAKVLRSHVISLSVILVDRDHIG